MSSSELKIRMKNAVDVLGIQMSELRCYLTILGILSVPLDKDAGNFVEPPGSGEEHSDIQYDAWAKTGALALLNSDTTTYEDAARVFLEKQNVLCEAMRLSRIGIARFKAGWAILKGKGQSQATQDTESKNDLTTILQTLKPVSQLSDRELLDRYSENAASDVMKELKERSKDRAFVVFESGKNTINVDATLQLLRVARRQETPSTFMVDGLLVRTHRVGEFTMSSLDECPIHQNVLLTGDFCEECQNSWNGVSHRDRVMMRVAQGIKGVSLATDVIGINVLITKARSGKSPINGIPAVQLAYSELETDGKLPTLKRRLSKSGGKSDPFFVHKTF